MTTTIKGAYCGACCKEVTDFTSMSDEEVQHYFLNKTSGETCGRFRQEQLHCIRIHLPDTIFIKKIASWKKFMAIILLAFGSMLFGCDVGINDPKIEKAIISSANKAIQAADNFKSEMDGMVGGMMLVMDTTTSTKTECTTTVGYILPGLEFDLVADDIKIDSTVQVNVPDTVVKPTIDTTNTIFTERIIPKDTAIKKSATDTLECKDTGYY